MWQNFGTPASILPIAKKKKKKMKSNCIRAVHGKNTIKANSSMLPIVKVHWSQSPSGLSMAKYNDHTPSGLSMAKYNDHTPSDCWPWKNDTQVSFHQCCPRQKYDKVKFQQHCPWQKYNEVRIRLHPCKSTINIKKPSLQPMAKVH